MPTRVIVAVAAVCGLLAGGGSAASTPLQVFVLAGQSNMAGHGQPLSFASPTDARLLVWRETAWQVAADPLEPPANPPRDDEGIGPGMTFGLQLLKREPSVRIGLIMCAKGGSSIQDWDPDGSLYGACADQVRAVGGRIAGVLFLQGETEARSADRAATWLPGFVRLLAAFRRDTNSAPFLLGQIGTLGSQDKAQQLVRDAQAEAARLYHLLLVRTSDLPVDARDREHFTVPAYRVVGGRFATAWWQAERPATSPPRAPASRPH